MQVDTRIAQILGRTTCADARRMLHDGRVSQAAWEGYMDVWHDIPRETKWAPSTDPDALAWADAIRGRIAPERG